MLGVIQVERTSELAADADRVWAHATSMAGVNAELRPWLRMTSPRGVELRPQVIQPPGEFAFHSWLLLGGVLPFDRHALGFEAMEPAQRWFNERSSSWVQREWVHRRSIAALGSGCRLTDLSGKGSRAAQPAASAKPSAGAKPGGGKRRSSRGRRGGRRPAAAGPRG